ncbi:hypothetical protein BU15DRAFT_53347, partial [Melanogaster broomeanus]
PCQLVASHVCQHWRNVALSTPSLWAAIPILHVRPPYEHVSTLLERSKGLPIDILTDICHPDEGDEDEDSERTSTQTTTTVHLVT